MAGLSSALWIVGSYIVIFVFIFFVINFLTKGWLRQYLKVKASLGKLVFVKCYDATDSFYKSGKIDSHKTLVVKDRNKEVHMFFNIKPTDVGRELGLNLIEVSLVKGHVIRKDFESASSFDLTMTDKYVNEAYNLPKWGKGLDKWKQMEILFFIIIIVGIGVCIFLLATQPQATTEVINAGANI